MKKTGFNSHICEFHFDYDSIAVDDILYSHSQLFDEKKIHGIKNV